MKFSFEIKGTKELATNMDKMSKEMVSALKDALEMAAALVERYSKEETPVDMGSLRASIIPSFKPFEAIIAPHKDYAIFVHEGTRPHFPPVDVIERWAARHGMAGAGYQIARAISVRGTKGVPFMEKGLEKAKKEITQIFEGKIEGVIRKY